MTQYLSVCLLAMIDWGFSAFFKLLTDKPSIVSIIVNLTTL